MKNTKRLLCLLLCAAMALSLLAACGGQGEETQGTSNPTEAETSVPTTVPETMVPETTVTKVEPQETNLTVGEFEEQLNTMLKAADIPLEYDFFEWHRYGDIRNRVTYTGSDNPFIVSVDGYEYDTTGNYFSFWMMRAVHSGDTDQSPITEFSISTDYRDETDPQIALFRQVIPIIISACDSQITDEELDEFMSMEFIKSESSNDIEYKVFQNDVIHCEVSEWNDSSHVSDGTNEWYEDSLRVDIEFLNVSSDNRNIPSGEELLDPKYLDYHFEVHQPMVMNEVFNINTISFTRQYDGISYDGFMQEALDDYLGATKTPLLIGDYWLTKTAEYYGFFSASGWDLDPSVFYIAWNWDDTEVAMHYSTSEEYFQGFEDGEPEYIIRAAIGLSMLLDEGITAEEAVELHTHAMASTTTEDGWQFSCYCPRDVMHIVEVNPATGENIYYLMTKEYFDIMYGSVEEFLFSKS